MKILPYILGTLSTCGCTWFVVCLIWRRRWLLTNLANIITGLGIKFCFGLLWLVVFYPEKTFAILSLAGVVILSDWADGVVARYFENKGYHGSVSNFGKGMDRFRDKFFQLTMFSYFLPHKQIDSLLEWAICPFMIVETFLLLLLFLGIKRKTDVAAGAWGKAKMVLTSIGILACMAVIMVKERGTKVPHYIDQLLFLIFVISLGLAVMSLIKHVVKHRAELKKSHL
ncbi:MAG: CDP-alcohol phosphatidyltransferase family protein [Candidatus Staskawiczbacteria bacterium]|nr:CDP-alcohol phosphatidyltransferase family protein [Candidatus Staskawiczbacteria bacterium]